MLSTQLHSHIDRMDAIEEQAQADIDKIISAIDVKELIRDPHGVMQQVAEEISGLMADKYMALASQQGFSLVKILEKLENKGQAVKIDPSKDPTKNKDIVA